MKLKMQTIAALALTASCLGFTLPSYATPSEYRAVAFPPPTYFPINSPANADVNTLLEKLASDQIQQHKDTVKLIQKLQSEKKNKVYRLDGCSEYMRQYNPNADRDCPPYNYG